MSIATNWLACALAATSTGALGADLAAVVKDQDGRALEDAVVVAVPADGVRVRPNVPKTPEVVDQIDKEFVPRVKPIVVGSSVAFPNHDDIHHQVYSFSPAKRFELPLYAGTPAKPVVFDQPGVVVLGCNIHDWMIGYVYVSESPWFAKTGKQGTALLQNLPAGRYTVRAWHPRLDGDEKATAQVIDLKSAVTDAAWTLKLKPAHPIRRAPTPGGQGRY